MRHCCVRKLVWLLEELQWLRSQLEHNREQHQMQITYLCRQSQNLAVATQQHVHLWVGLLLHWSLSAVCVHLYVCVCVFGVHVPLLDVFSSSSLFFFSPSNIWNCLFTSLSMKNDLTISSPSTQILFSACLYYPRIYLSRAHCAARFNGHVYPGWPCSIARVCFFLVSFSLSAHVYFFSPGP